ncbi:citrate lyase subunit alpha [Klebsiella michiganensis]|nr:citrate lyase subunit alpha [Klebsiella michiganensis]
MPARSLANNPNHIEISANQYANPGSKGVSCERLNVVMLSALEIDTGFNVNVMTGSNGVLRGASRRPQRYGGGRGFNHYHRGRWCVGRIPCVVEKGADLRDAGRQRGCAGHRSRYRRQPGASGPD